MREEVFGCLGEVSKHAHGLIVLVVSKPERLLRPKKLVIDAAEEAKFPANSCS